MANLYSLYDICFDYCKTYRTIPNISAKEERIAYKNDTQYRKELFLKVIDAMELTEFYNDYCKENNNKFSEEWRDLIIFLLQAIDSEQDTKRHKDYFAVLDNKNPKWLLGRNSFYEKFMLFMIPVINTSKKTNHYMELFSNSNFVLRHTEQCVRTNTLKTLQALLDKLSADTEFNNKEKIDNFTYIENMVNEALFTIYPNGLHYD